MWPKGLRYGNWGACGRRDGLCEAVCKIGDPSTWIGVFGGDHSCSLGGWARSESHDTGFDRCAPHRVEQGGNHPIQTGRPHLADEEHRGVEPLCLNRSRPALLHGDRAGKCAQVVPGRRRRVVGDEQTVRLAGSFEHERTLGAVVSHVCVALCRIRVTGGSIHNTPRAYMFERLAATQARHLMCGDEHLHPTWVIARVLAKRPSDAFSNEERRVGDVRHDRVHK